MDIQQLIETRQISNRINLYLLDAIPGEDLAHRPGSKGRNAGEQFAHIHNVRLMWLKASMPEELAGQTKLDKENAGDKELLKLSLEQSAVAIVRLPEFAAVNGGCVKGFKPHIAAFIGYLTAHDAHHRSQIIIALKHLGSPLAKKILYGMWEWGAR